MERSTTATEKYIENMKKNMLVKNEKSMIAIGNYKKDKKNTI